MSVHSSGDGGEDDKNWFDFDDTSSLPSLSLEEALSQLDNFDNSLLYPEVANGINDCASAAEFSGRTSTSGRPLGYRLECPLQCEALASISHQLRTSEARAGRPTAIAKCNGKLAVCTSRGVLMLFDEESERLEHSVFSEREFGAASSVAFSDDASHIAVGFAKGALKVVNTKSAYVTYTIMEATQPGRGVLQVLFLTRQRTLLVLDSGGSVFELRVRRTLTGKRKEHISCIFSGCNGEVVHMRFVPHHNILLLLTLRKILLVSTMGGGRAIASIPLSGPAEALPLCDFITGAHTIFLAAARGSAVFLYRVFPRRVGLKIVEQIAAFKLPRSLMAIGLVSEDWLWCLDANEAVGVVGTRTHAWMQLDGHPRLQPTFATADYKGLATGVDVSAAMACVADRACYPAICLHPGKVTLLGSSIFSFSLLSELDMIRKFEQRSDLISAALYVSDLLKECAASKNKKNELELVTELPNILKSLTDFTLSGLPGGKIADLIAHYKTHIDCLLRVCINTQQLQFFYQRVYPRLEQDVLAHGVLFELLDEIVLDGALIEPPPTLISHYLTNLMQEGHFSQLQAAIVRLPIDAIDIHWVISTCRANRLFDGIIYISNRAFFDFISPLEEMFDEVKTFCSHELRSDSETEIGNKLMLYLHCCLAGRAYPYGELPADLANVVPLEVFRCITSLRGKNGSVNSNLNYPYLRILLQYDPQQFLNLICTCADAPIFVEEARLQRLLEMLCAICVSSPCERSLSHLVACFAHLSTHASVLVQQPMLEETVDLLLANSHISVLAECAVVDLIRAIPSLPTCRILQLAQRNPVKVKICTHIFTADRRFTDLIRCLLQNHASSSEIFDIIMQLLRSDLSLQEFEDLVTYLKSEILTLAKFSYANTAVLVVDHLIVYLADLQSRECVLMHKAQNYMLLRECFALKRHRGEKTLTSDDDLDEALLALTISGIIAEVKNCEAADSLLADWLKYWLSLGARSDKCLNIVVSADLTESSILLYEARGFCERVFKLLEERLISLSSSESSDEQTILKIIDRCVQCCTLHDEEARAGSWMKILFDHVIAWSQQQYVKAADASGVVERILLVVQRLLDSDSSIAHQLIIALYDANFFATASFGDHSSLLYAILTTCEQQSVLLRSLLACRTGEVRDAQTRLTRQATRRLRHLAGGGCVVCRGGVETRAIFVFECGHVVHMECDAGSTRICPCETLPLLGFPKPRAQLLHSSSDEGRTSEIISDSALFLGPQCSSS